MRRAKKKLLPGTDPTQLLSIPSGLILRAQLRGTSLLCRLERRAERAFVFARLCPLPQPHAASFELEKWSSRYLHTFHPTFHFARDTTGRHATPRDTMWLMLLNFPNGVGG
jgi:hypothetical protein